MTEVSTNSQLSKKLKYYIENNVHRGLVDMNKQQKGLLLKEKEELEVKIKKKNKTSTIGLVITIVGIPLLLFGIGVLFIVVGLFTLIANGVSSSNAKKQLKEIEFKLAGSEDK